MTRTANPPDRGGGPGKRPDQIDAVSFSMDDSRSNSPDDVAAVSDLSAADEDPPPNRYHFDVKTLRRGNTDADDVRSSASNPDSADYVMFDNSAESPRMHDLKPDIFSHREFYLALDRAVSRNLSDIQTDVQQSNTRDVVVEEVNKRIIAPLLFGFSVLLLAGAVGAAASGSFLLSLIFLPFPLATGWLLWKVRDVW